MIIQFILSAIMSALKAILGILPNIPPMPDFIRNSAEFISNIILSGVSVVAYIYPQPQFGFLVLVIIVLINFETIMRTTLWIIRKLPISSS